MKGELKEFTLPGFVSIDTVRVKSFVRGQKWIMMLAGGDSAC